MRCYISGVLAILIGVARLRDEADIQIQIWREQRDKAKQCEDQRALITNIVLVLASAGIGLVVQHGVKDRAMLLVSISLVLLGGYGAITSLKYRERYAYHNAQAKVIVRRLDEMYPALHWEADRDKAINQHGERKGYVKISRLSLSGLWVSMHAAISVIGVALTIVITSQA